MKFRSRSKTSEATEHRDFSAPWRRDPFDRDGAVDALMEELAQIGGLAAACVGHQRDMRRNGRGNLRELRNAWWARQE